MDRDNPRRWIAMLLISAGLALRIGGCEWLFPEPPATKDQTVVGVTEIDGIPSEESADGRTDLLDRLNDCEEDAGRFAPDGLFTAPLAVRPKDAPETVDLRSFQTRIKDQWGGTCLQSAKTAAVTARYRRVDADDLDLSGRFGLLLQKMGV